MKLLGISGSLRRNGYNVMIRRTIANRLPPGAELTVFPLDDLRLCNQDVEAEPEGAVELLHPAIAASDGVVIATRPEQPMACSSRSCS